MALTKTPIELSSTPSIVDGGNATAITIDSSENVTFAGTATAVGLTVTSSSSNAGTFKAVGGYALQAYQDATSADHTALDLRSDHVSGGTNRYLIRGYNTAAGTPIESFNVNTAGGAYFAGGVVFSDAGGTGTSTSNTLDSYEEGTFTATIRGSTAEPGTLATTTLTSYTKIGNTVHCRIGFINVDTTGYGGHLSVAGLPFPSAVSNLRTACVPAMYNIGAFTADYVVGLVEQTTKVFFYGIKTANTWNTVTHNAGGGRYLEFNLTYHTDN
jgi:hypothetical protein